MPAQTHERRRVPRIDLEQVVQIRPFAQQLPSEYCTTINVSKNGLYFVTSTGHYIPGMSVYVTGGIQPGSPSDRDLAGAIVRIEKLEADQFGIAVQLFPEG